MNYQDSHRNNIFVSVRVRPLNDRECREGTETCLRVDPARPNQLQLETKPDPKFFSFDWVASESTSQEDVFEGVGKSMVETCLQGRLHFLLFEPHR